MTAASESAFTPGKGLALVAALMAVSFVGIKLPDWLEVRDVKAAVSRDFYDPDSAQFRDLVKVRDGIICGEVNAKNRLGSYVGYSRFHARKSGERWLVVVDSDDATLASKWCAE